MLAKDERQTFDLPDRTREELSDERRTSIRNALQSYRERVLEQNLSELRKVINEIESDPPSSPKITEDEASKERIESLREDSDIWLDDPTITTIRDLLSEDRRENLIRTNRLDGITHGEVDLAVRNAWIEDIEKKMSTDERALIRPSGLPADLKYLMTLVRGICGPGLPDWRFYNQLKFLSDLDEDEACLGNWSSGTEVGWIAVPNMLQDLDGKIGDLPYDWHDSKGEEHKVAMAVGIGQCSFAVYCRKQNEGDDGGHGQGGSGGEWSWKYGQQEMPCCHPLYDTIEDFLAWYAEWPSED